MEMCNIRAALVVMMFAFVMLGGIVVNGEDSSSFTPLVPAIISFGDSSVDVGNNDHRLTVYKANYPPYGRDFGDHRPTGRFCNGKLVTDITAELLGFKSFAPAYLSPQASGNNLLIGANFASAGSGYDHNTSIKCNAIPLSVQLKHYSKYQKQLARVAGIEKSSYIIKEALYLLGFGTSDFALNYYANPSLNKAYTADQYSDYLVTIFSGFIKDLHGLGARKIGATSLAPLGCLPGVKTLFGNNESGCVAKINTACKRFNKKLNLAAVSLKKELYGLKLVIFDIYTPLYDILKSPAKQGFKHAKKSCCGIGTVNTTIFLCNPKKAETCCSNANEHVFFDDVHPSEAVNQIIADALILQGFGLI